METCASVCDSGAAAAVADHGGSAVAEVVVQQRLANLSAALKTFIWAPKTTETSGSYMLVLRPNTRVFQKP